MEDSFIKFILNVRNSPLRNDILQEMIKKKQAEMGLPVAEVSLLLDVRTRWNSILVMVDSFFKVRAKRIFCTYGT
jgi:hypothetical protein